jgi:hypothetical protein
MEDLRIEIQPPEKYKQLQSINASSERRSSGSHGIVAEQLYDIHSDTHHSRLYNLWPVV